MRLQRAGRTVAAPLFVAVTASGNVEQDAQYIMMLRTLKQRQHELWRVGHIHGEKHRAAVEKRVTELWKQN